MLTSADAASTLTKPHAFDYKNAREVTEDIGGSIREPMFSHIHQQMTQGVGEKRDEPHEQAVLMNRKE